MVTSAVSLLRKTVPRGCTRDTVPSWTNRINGCRCRSVANEPAGRSLAGTAMSAGRVAYRSVDMPVCAAVGKGLLDRSGKLLLQRACDCLELLKSGSEVFDDFAR